MGKKSSGQRAFEAGFKAGLGKPKPKKKPQRSSSGGGSRGSSSRSNYNDGNVEWKGGDRSWTGPSHGTDSRGQPVTISFGREGANQQGASLIRDGHAQKSETFYGPPGKEGHDHYDGRGGGTDRGKYSG